MTVQQKTIVFVFVLLSIITNVLPFRNDCEMWTPMADSNTLIVNCSRRNITSSLIDTNFTSVKHLVISYSNNPINKLEQLSKTNISTLSISYSHCNVSSLQFGLFQHVVNILQLDLSWNLLQGSDIKQEVFHGPQRDGNKFGPIELQELNLAHNQIQNLHHKTFSFAPKLKRINLSHNPFLVVDAGTAMAISSLIDLRELDLSGTQLTTIPDSLTKGLRLLRYLDVSYNKLMDVPDSFTYLYNLDTLKIGGNFIEQLDNRSFIGLKLLRVLDISNSPLLMTINQDTFKGLEQLQMLNANNNTRLHQIQNYAFGFGSKLSMLRELYLKNTALEIISSDLLNMSNLQVLDLSDNNWNCNCSMYEALKLQLDRYVVRMHTSHLAICSRPIELNGLPLYKLTSEICSLQQFQDKLMENNHVKYILFTVLIFLSLVAAFVFWRLLLKFRSIRAINAPYSIVYINDLRNN